MKRAYEPPINDPRPLIPTPHLPDALWAQVAKNLSPIDQLRFSHTNSYFRDIVRDSVRGTEREWGVRRDVQDRFLAHERQRLDKAMRGFLWAVADHDNREFNMQIHGKDTTARNDAAVLAMRLYLLKAANSQDIPAILNACGFPRNSRTEHELSTMNVPAQHDVLDIGFSYYDRMIPLILEDLGGADGLKRTRQEHLWEWSAVSRAENPLDPSGYLLYRLTPVLLRADPLPAYLVNWGHEILADMERMNRHQRPSRAFPYVLLDPSTHQFTMDPRPLFRHPRGPSAFPM